MRHAASVPLPVSEVVDSVSVVLSGSVVVDEEDELVVELEEYDAAHPEVTHEVMAFARLTLAQLCSDGVNESASRYARLQQVEAAGRLRDLEQALTQLRSLERQRADAWREAAHDLRGKLGVVKTVTEILSDDRLPESNQREIRTMLQQGVESLHALLEDLIL